MIRERSTNRATGEMLHYYYFCHHHLHHHHHHHHHHYYYYYKNHNNSMAARLVFPGSHLGPLEPFTPGPITDTIGGYIMDQVP